MTASSENNENRYGASRQLAGDLQIVHDSMLDGLGQLADYFGFNKVLGQLYGTLLLSAEPLSLDDMMSRLDISKASVSTNMRSLEHMGMVRQVWVRGGSGRRKYYQAETDFLADLHHHHERTRNARYGTRPFRSWKKTASASPIP